MRRRAPTVRDVRAAAWEHPRHRLLVVDAELAHRENGALGMCAPAEEGARHDAEVPGPAAFKPPVGFGRSACVYTEKTMHPEPYFLTVVVIVTMLTLVFVTNAFGRSGYACPHCGTRTGAHCGDCPWAHRP